MTLRTAPMDRRRFLLSATAAAATLRTSAQAALTASQAATLTLHPDKPGPIIPANFVGLSYETQQLTDPDFFSLKNTGLIAQFKALAPHGVLRLGGNTSDVGWWKPTPTSRQPPLPSKVVVIPLRPDERPFHELAYSITPEAVRNLRSFLDSTGWTCLYGINLGTSTPERAAEEAAFVAGTLGPKLEYFQLGNEPDIFYNRFRVKSAWTADLYFDEWLASANAIRAAVPNASFGLPDTSGNPEWYAKVVERFLALDQNCSKCDELPAAYRADCSCREVSGNESAPTTQPNIAALSHHYYFGGPPSNPKVNIADMLAHSERVDTLARNIATATESLNKKFRNKAVYRMTEGNTCYRGGKPAVSDVFAASLWAADYALTLASLGYAGVNLHGGSGKAVADSLGGTLPGELLMPDPKAPHPRPFYTPIAEIEGKYIAEPVFYGLLFAQKFSGGTIIPVDFNPGSVNATAYAVKTPEGRTRIAVINKDAVQAVRLSPGIVGRSQMRLTAPGLGSKQVSFHAEPVFKGELEVPANSAVFLES